MEIREYRQSDVLQMVRIWNEVVNEGNAFPQKDPLTPAGGERFFAEQSCCAVAADPVTEEVAGLTILHPNNVGRCGHIANASYAVKKTARGGHIGEKLVRDSLVRARNLGFLLLQFNAVVGTNRSARHLYEKLGFHQVGIVPKGFLMKNGVYEDIVLYYHEL